jgi:hypothetical protein
MAKKVVPVGVLHYSSLAKSLSGRPGPHRSLR